MKAPTDPGMVREAALATGVCARPVIARVSDLETGEQRIVPIACGTTREALCPPCADRARKLRMHQCREGWHLTTEPERQAGDGDDDQDDALADADQRRVRSTRRRQDVPDLPRVPMDDRTIGATFTAPDGREFRPSMFLTLTLDSYGPVDEDGCPRDPGSYDYRRAALDAIHFPKLVDRFWQNMRRCACYNLQYFASVEAQRRLAPHLHAAVRGVVPRRLFRQVRAATYHQVWWPAHDIPVYDGRWPVWTDEAGYVDPDTGAPLATWDDALHRVTEPAHVLRFGVQDDYQGLLPGAPGAEWAIGYLCKYLTKTIAHTYGDEPAMSSARAAHVDRLAEEVRWLPCTPGCANWLRYGVQPKGAEQGLTPGHCGHKAHDRENLGLGGRRVLVSRRWTGKTLAGHKADRAAVVRAVLEEAGVDPDDHDELAIGGSDGVWDWEILGRSRIDNETYAAAIADAIDVHTRWHRQYEAAKARAGPIAAGDRQFGNDGRRKQ